MTVMVIIWHLSRIDQSIGSPLIRLLMMIILWDLMLTGVSESSSLKLTLDNLHPSLLLL